MELDKIYCMDALELLSKLDAGSVDFVCCDLPYGVTDLTWDSVIPLEPMWAQIKRVLKPLKVAVFTATEPFATDLRMSNRAWYKYDWYWSKSITTMFAHAKNRPLRKIENVLVFSEGSINHASISKKRMPYFPQMTEGAPYKTQRDPAKRHGTIVGHRPSNRMFIADNEGVRYPHDLLEFPNPNHENFHPTQKPLKLMQYLIETYTQEGELVVDMTCGSGTTAVAAKLLDRRFICGDISPDYVKVAQDRLAAADPLKDKPLSNGMKQRSLFEDI